MLTSWKKLVWTQHIHISTGVAKAAQLFDILVDNVRHLVYLVQVALAHRCVLCDVFRVLQLLFDLTIPLLTASLKFEYPTSMTEQALIGHDNIAMHELHVSVRREALQRAAISLANAVDFRRNLAKGVASE